MKIQSALFDIGNVLVLFDYERIFQRFEATALGQSQGNRAAIFALREQFELGQLPRSEFAPRARQILGHQGKEEEFIEIWEDIFDENPPMNALVKNLSSRMPLYLLSNTNCIHREYLERKFPIFQHFRGGVFSYEAGMLKPNPEIFAHTARTLALDPASTLYLDDMPENAQAARQAGFSVVEYKYWEHERAVAEITEKLGFAPT